MSLSWASNLCVRDATVLSLMRAFGGLSKIPQELNEIREILHSGGQGLAGLPKNILQSGKKKVDSFSAWGTIPERGEKHITTLCKLYFLVKMLWLIHEGPVGPTASLPRLLPAHHQVFKNGLHVTVSGSRILPGLRLNGLRAAWSFSISWEKWISKTLLCL